MCIRAPDYIPPVDLTFGEYLRALITADYDLVRDDDRRYRVAVVAAFRDWGIYPDEVRSLSVDSLLWLPPERSTFDHASDFFSQMGPETWTLGSDRRESYLKMKDRNCRFHTWLRDNLQKKLDKDETNGPDAFLGLALGPKAPNGVERDKDKLPKFEVHSFRPCRRVGFDGQERIDAVVEIVQRRLGFFNEGLQRDVDAGKVLYEEAKAKKD